MTYKCLLCGKEYRTIGGLVMHVRAVHTHGNRCPICGREFPSKNGLCIHLARRAYRGSRIHAFLLYVMSNPKSRKTRRMALNIWLNGGDGKR